MMGDWSRSRKRRGRDVGSVDGREASRAHGTAPQVHPMVERAGRARQDAAGTMGLPGEEREGKEKDAWFCRVKRFILHD